MSRPWWYDEYWKKDEKRTRGRLQPPPRKTWVWIAIMVLSVLMAAASTGFILLVIPWIIGVISSFCKILLYSLVIRAVLSWFPISRSHIIIKLLDDIAEPILTPLRKVMPSTGIFDLSIIVAAIILYFLPLVLNFLIIKSIEITVL